MIWIAGKRHVCKTKSKCEGTPPLDSAHSRGRATLGAGHLAEGSQRLKRTCHPRWTTSINDGSGAHLLRERRICVAAWWGGVSWPGSWAGGREGSRTVRSDLFAAMGQSVIYGALIRALIRSSVPAGQGSTASSKVQPPLASKASTHASGHWPPPPPPMAPNPEADCARQTMRRRRKKSMRLWSAEMRCSPEKVTGVINIWDLSI